MHQLARSHFAQCAASVAMGLQTAHALLMVAKKNRVVDVMLTLYKDEVKTFGRNSIMRDCIPEDPVLPANRCCINQGGGRCRGAAGELSITQLCAYHNAREIGDLLLDRLRRNARDHPGVLHPANNRARE